MSLWVTCQITCIPTQSLCLISAINFQQGVMLWEHACPLIAQLQLWRCFRLWVSSSKRLGCQFKELLHMLDMCWCFSVGNISRILPLIDQVLDCHIAQSRNAHKDQCTVRTAVVDYINWSRIINMDLWKLFICCWIINIYASKQTLASKTTYHIHHHEC